MARSISKNVASATVSVFDPSQPFELDANGMPIANASFELSGKPSANAARIQAEKRFGKNVLVMGVEIDETKLTVSPDVFFANSKPCVNGESYGRDTIVQTFKFTEFEGFTIGANGMEPFNDVYAGVTTDSKLLKFAREQHGMASVITSSMVREQRRYMAKVDYLALAQ